MSINFNSKPTYSDCDKYIKTKIKTYKDSITINFHNKKEPKKTPEGKIPHTCSPIIILDPVLCAYEKYHPQIFLEAHKYAKENIKSKNYIDNELKSDSDTNDSDSDNNNNNNNNNNNE